MHARLVAFCLVAAVFAGCRGSATPTAQPTISEAPSGVPAAFATGICKVISDTRALTAVFTPISEALAKPDMAAAETAVTAAKSAITNVQAELDQLASWPDGQLVVTRLRETFDGLQDSLNQFTTGLHPHTVSVLQQALTTGKNAFDKLKLAMAAFDSLKSDHPLPC